MVLLYDLDGNETIKRHIPPRDINKHIEGFLALRNYHRNGSLYQLIGTERKLLRRFGTVDLK